MLFRCPVIIHYSSHQSHKLSVKQPISQTTYDLNSKLLVCYSSHVLNNKLFVRYLSHDLNNKPFDERTILDHSNTKLIYYSDPLCTQTIVKNMKFSLLGLVSNLVQLSVLLSQSNKNFLIQTGYFLRPFIISYIVHFQRCPCLVHNYCEACKDFERLIVG